MINQVFAFIKTTNLINFFCLVSFDINNNNNLKWSETLKVHKNY